MTGDLKQDFREAMAHLATAVSVITTSVEGTCSGMTASAVCSLSMEPELLLVCINQRAAMHDAVRKCGKFAVNVLPQGAEQLALSFARPSTTDKFAGVPLVPGSDPPLLRDALSTFVCALQECIPGGDHSIFVGKVEACARRAGAPLLHFRRKFGYFDDPEDRLARHAAAEQ
jgi:3-hydroxy-9,10-secoandrosta-1,3,5(10)-triene-9,17-dione monooxygenase reductase component